MSNDFSVCANCGTKLSETARVCYQCGRPVSDEAAIKKWEGRETSRPIKRGTWRPAPTTQLRPTQSVATCPCADERVEPLIRALKDSNRDGRRNAAAALGEIGEPAVEPLIRALDQQSWDVRFWAELLLGQIGDARAVEPLIRMLDTQPVVIDRISDYGIASHAAQALGEIGDARAVEPLIRMLDHHSDDIRWRTISALGSIGDARAIEPLSRALREEDDKNARASAARALGYIGDARATSALRFACDSDSDEYLVRETAIEALGRIYTKKTVVRHVKLKFCENCGRKVSLNGQLCARCGADLSGVNEYSHTHS
jgi:HEAT repeat protein